MSKICDMNGQSLGHGISEDGKNYYQINGECSYGSYKYEACYWQRSSRGEADLVWKSICFDRFEIIFFNNQSLELKIGEKYIREFQDMISEWFDQNKDRWVDWEVPLNEETVRFFMKMVDLRLFM